MGCLGGWPACRRAGVDALTRQRAGQPTNPPNRLPAPAGSPRGLFQPHPAAQTCCPELLQAPSSHLHVSTPIETCRFAPGSSPRPPQASCSSRLVPAAVQTLSELSTPPARAVHCTCQNCPGPCKSCPGLLTPVRAVQLCCPTPVQKQKLAEGSSKQRAKEEGSSGLSKGKARGQGAGFVRNGENKKSSTRQTVQRDLRGLWCLGTPFSVARGRSIDHERLTRAPNRPVRYTEANVSTSQHVAKLGPKKKTKHQASRQETWARNAQVTRAGMAG